MIKSIKGNEFKIDFEEEIEGTYIVGVSVDNEEFSVNCQTYMTHSYEESSNLSCRNESGGDISDSGLAGKMESLGIEQDTEEWNLIENLIETEADANMDENTVYAYLEQQNVAGITANSERLDNFGTFYPHNVYMSVYRFDNKDDDYCVAVFEEEMIPLIKNAVHGHKVFGTKEDWQKFRTDVHEGIIDGSNVYAHYGDFTASKRAYDAICGLD